MLKRSLLLILTLSALTPTAEPAWFLEREPVAGMLSGYGSGTNADSARMAALRDLLEALAVSVRASRRSFADESTTVIGNSATSALSTRYTSAISTASSLRDLTGVTLARQADVDGVSFVLIQAETAPVMQALADRLTRLQAEPPHKAPKPVGGPTWDWVRSQQAIAGWHQQCDTIRAILVSHGITVADASPRVAAATLGMLADDVTLHIDGSASAAAVLRSAMGGLPLSVVDHTDLTLAPVLEITRERTDRGWHRALSTLTVQVTRAAAGLGRFAVSASASSTADPDMAQRRSEAALVIALHSALEKELLPILLATPLEPSP